MRLPIDAELVKDSDPLQRAEVRCSIETPRVCEWSRRFCCGCSARKCAALLRLALAMSPLLYRLKLQRAEVRCSIETEHLLDRLHEIFPLQRAEVRCSIETPRVCEWSRRFCCGCSARKCAALLRHLRFSTRDSCYLNLLQRAEVRCSIETSPSDVSPALSSEVAARGSAL